MNTSVSPNIPTFTPYWSKHRVHRPGEQHYTTPGVDDLFKGLTEKAIGLSQAALMAKACMQLLEENLEKAMKESEMPVKYSRQWWALYVKAIRAYVLSSAMPAPGTVLPWVDVGLHKMDKSYWSERLPLIEWFVAGGKFNRLEHMKGFAFNSDVSFYSRNMSFHVPDKTFNQLLNAAIVEAEDQYIKKYMPSELIGLLKEISLGYNGDCNWILPCGTVVYRNQIDAVRECLAIIRQALKLLSDSKGLGVRPEIVSAWTNRHTFHWYTQQEPMPVVNVNFSTRNVSPKLGTREWWVNNLAAFKAWLSGSLVLELNGINLLDTFHELTRESYQSKLDVIEHFAKGGTVMDSGECLGGVISSMFTYDRSRYMIVKEDKVLVDNDRIKITDTDIIFKRPDFSFDRAQWKDYALQALKDWSDGKKELYIGDRRLRSWGSIGTQIGTAISMIESWVKPDHQLYIEGRQVADYERISFDSFETLSYVVVPPVRKVDLPLGTREWWLSTGLKQLREAIHDASRNLDFRGRYWHSCPLHLMLDRFLLIEKWAKGEITVVTVKYGIFIEDSSLFDSVTGYRVHNWDQPEIFTRQDWAAALPKLKTFIQYGGKNETFVFDCDEMTPKKMAAKLPSIEAFIAGGKVFGYEDIAYFDGRAEAYKVVMPGKEEVVPWDQVSGPAQVWAHYKGMSHCAYLFTKYNGYYSVAPATYARHSFAEMCKDYLTIDGKPCGVTRVIPGETVLPLPLS